MWPFKKKPKMWPLPPDPPDYSDVPRCSEPTSTVWQGGYYGMTQTAYHLMGSHGLVSTASVDEYPYIKTVKHRGD